MSNTNKPLTAEEMIRKEYEAYRVSHPDEDWLDWDDMKQEQSALRGTLMFMISAMEQYAAQQTAAKDAEIAKLREELDMYKYALKSKEQEKQEYIDKIELALEELEAVKKERDDCKSAFEGLQSVLSNTLENRNEAVKLLKECPVKVLIHNRPDLLRWGKERDNFLSRLSSGETKPVSPWISVEDRLPDVSNVIVARRTGVLECKFMDGKFSLFYYEGMNAIPIEVTEVTHWMPLPAPPESKNN